MIICALPKGENSKEYNHAGRVSCRSILLFVTLYYRQNGKYLLLQGFSKKLTKSLQEKKKSTILGLLTMPIWPLPVQIPWTM